MIRSSKLPLLPGYSFDREVGQTRYHKSTQFEYLRGSIPYLSENDRPGTGGYPLSWKTPDTTPSVYPRREVKELPGWIVFDKQILAFDAYFQETMWEIDKCPYQIRKVKIYYFPEDGTVQVVEPKVENSGMSQGLLIARQRIRFPKPMDHAFYDLIDFNIGKNVELFGKVFRIVNCDQFTRNFLNRMGIFVGDPLNYPVDPLRAKEEKKKLAIGGKRPRKTPAPLGKYIKFDKKVLRFYAYWDDRATQYGFVHKLIVYFYLADDNIEIIEEIPPNAGRNTGKLFLRKMKLPKNFTGPPTLGEEESFCLLNVLPTGFLEGKTAIDVLGLSATKTDYYRENDLAIGAALNVFGKKVVLVDCDEFTKEYYSTKYGLDTFDPLTIPDDNPVNETYKRELPPWNGIGSYEDSENNCVKVLLEPPKKDMYKFLTKGRQGYNSHVLRFRAKMVSMDLANNGRQFIISYYLSDDQISIYEKAARNSGFATKYFASKREIFKPDQNRYVSEKPKTFQKEEFWVGNEINIDGFKFKLISADEYCLRYMELHSQEFPKSNAKLILDKIREKLRPKYKEFVSRHLSPHMKNYDDCRNVIGYGDLRQALLELLGDDITEHEIITIARQFRVHDSRTKFSKNEVVNICRTECRRLIWLGFDRLMENLYYKDPCGTGFIPQQVAVSLCKGAKIPISNDILQTVMKQVRRNECGEVSIEDLLNYFDTQGCVGKLSEPISLKKEFFEFEDGIKESTDYSLIDIDCFLESLHLEEKLKNEGHTEELQKAEITPEQAATLPQ